MPFIKKSMFVYKTAITAVMLIIAVTSASAQRVPSETWMGIYLGKAKIGYASFKIDKSNYLGKPGYRLDSSSTMRLMSMGDEADSVLDTTAYLNEDYEPLRQVFNMHSGGHTTVVTARFTSNMVIAEIESEGTKSIKEVPIPPGSKIVGDSTFYSSSMKFKVRDKVNLKWFNPLSLSLDDLQTEVLRQEELELRGTKYDTFVVRSLTPLGEMLCWQDKNGDLLKVVALMGITMISEPEEMAKGIPGTYTPPADLAVMASVPASKNITNPRQVKNMKIRLSGLLDKSLTINDNRQKVNYPDTESLTAEYEITASEFDKSKSAVLPVKNDDMQKLLEDTPYVQSAHKEIMAEAKQIVGEEKNSYAAASKLREWVNDNMQPKGTIGILRSSVDILHAKTGVCRDYAVLYTALTRAAGIPTKLVAGFVYWKGGFYYHAWAESFVGEWVPFDPTLPTDFVDATHIKLAEGEATAMFDMVKTMGSLKAEIIEAK